MSRYGDDRYYNRGRDANYPPRDRSRSRDSYSAGRSQGPGPFRGNGGYGRGGGGGGGGGRGGGGRGGRGGGGGGSFAPRPDRMMVKTNYFKIDIDDSKSEWIQYKVSIFKYAKCKGEDKRVIKNDDGTPKREKGTEILCTDSTEMTRRILRKLSDDLRSQRQVELVTDGSGSAYSNSPFFGGNEEEFDVKVKTDCDDDDPDADFSATTMVKVKLLKVGKVNPREQQVSEIDKIRQAMDIICKSALLSVGMKVFGRSPRVFYFPDEMQGRFIDNRSKLGDMFIRESNYTPIVGLMQAVRFCENGNIFFNCDSAVNFANREYAPRRHNNDERVSIPLLQVHPDGRRGEILGIPIDNIHQPITNEAKRAQIQAVFTQKIFHIKYTSQSEDDRQRMKNRGLSDQEISRRLVKLRKNVKMHIEKDKENDEFPSKGIGKCIIWNASDPNLYSFFYPREGDDKKLVSVNEYYRKKYSIQLRYPCMPIVYCGKFNGWIPVEFLVQAFSKMKDANSDAQKNAVLEHYDRNAGNGNVVNIQNILKQASRVLERRGLNVSHILSQYNLRLNDNPIEVMAKVLPEPNVSFANEQARLNNGSWNLMGKKFSNPAEVSSFAVANLSGKPHLASDFINTFLKVAENHGMSVANCDVQRLIANGRGVDTSPDEMRRTIQGAIDNARSFFLSSITLSGLLCNRHVWYSTRVKNANDEGWSDCLVLPDEYGDKCGVMLPTIIQHSTHTFMYQRQQKEGRMMVKVKESSQLIDPFDFRYNATLRSNEGKIGSTWQRLTFETKILVDGNGRFFPYHLVDELRPKFIIDKHRVECPSFVFIILPNDTSEHYGLAKMFCHFHFGVSCQCIVSSKYEGQRNKNQYCSNIAVKVNAKLSNHNNRALAWKTSPAGQSSTGITWVKEVATMVLGISTSSSLGEDGVSVICATASMDESCMRIAQDVRMCTKSKTETIDGTLLSSLVESLLIQYYQHNDMAPKRLLVYRDGVNEGCFNRLRKLEIESIRQGYRNFVKANTNSYPTCTNECKSGCVLCCPPITLVACMTRTNVKIVPADPREGNKNNVWSGTCVDATLIDKVDSLSLDNCPIDGRSKNMDPLLYSEPGGGGYDFLLTAQGGLKGTSKPVHYRIIWNENAVHQPHSGGSGLSKDKLELATYEMSYQYSTATKSVRLVPVIRYSSKCAKTVLKYARYLKDHNELIVQDLDETVDYGRSGIGSRKVLVRRDAKNNPFSTGSFSILPYFLPNLDAHGAISSARCSSCHISA